ncbi:MAG: DNA replication/repair protein RecF [Paraglaciecola sp.]|nr:DNA replication/repair protein RecF [Paraglaciecola sp.]NCT47035.1 DNA replication/repair protein RecF [Paraglaciecola sp.]
MILGLVQVSNFRNLDNLTLKPSPSLNIIVGANGSGKSSILEAIHYLGFSRSFRTSKHKNVIQHGKEEFTVHGKLQIGALERRLGLVRTRDDECLVSIDGLKSKSTADLVSQLPVQIFTPQSSELIVGAPNLRRKFSDWLLFHVEPEINQVFANFRRCSQQVNAIYKKSFSSGINFNEREIDYWLLQFCEFGQYISHKRETLLNSELQELILFNLSAFLPEFSFEISYYRGWEKDLSLYESLVKNVTRDLKNGYLGNGPQKADIRIKVRGLPVEEVLSRGQLRMLVAALQIAQAEYLKKKLDKTVVFLLDDIGAELDVSKQVLFIDKLLATGSQLFVTAISAIQLSYLDGYKNKKVFHVEHGQVIEEI